MYDVKFPCYVVYSEAFYCSVVPTMDLVSTLRMWMLNDFISEGYLLVSIIEVPCEEHNSMILS